MKYKFPPKKLLMCINMICCFVAAWNNSFYSSAEVLHQYYMGRHKYYIRSIAISAIHPIMLASLYQS